MAKFASVIAGVRGRKPIKLPLLGASVDPATGEWTGPTVDLAVRALLEDEYADVLAGALAYAKKKGIEKATEEDEVYERGKMLHTLLIACLDPESPTEAPAAFFDSIEQISRSEVMTPEVIAYLYLQQQAWQDEVNPLLKGVTPVEFFAAMAKMAGGDMGFFVHSRPGTLWSFMRIMASRLLASPELNSLPFSPSGPQEKTNPTGAM